MRHFKFGYAASALLSLYLSHASAEELYGNGSTPDVEQLSEIIFMSNATKPQDLSQQSPSNSSASAYRLLRTDWELPEGTCNEQTPCANGACCSRVSFTP